MNLSSGQRGHWWMMTIAGALFACSTTAAQACACCSDPGEYHLTTNEPSEYQLGQLQGLQFAPAAHLFSTDAGEDGITGLSTLAQDYGLLAKIEPRQIRLTFRTDDGKTGELILPFPAKMTTFAADIHDEAKSAGGGPLLYKEWRLEGDAAGSGIFAEAKTHYTLVLQGRGNRCDNTEDFKNWRLELSGKKTACAFFGELGTGVGDR